MNSVPQHCPPLSLSHSLRLTSWFEGGASRGFKSPAPLKAALRWRDAYTDEGGRKLCARACGHHRRLCRLQHSTHCLRNLPVSKRGAVFTFTPSFVFYSSFPFRFSSLNVPHLRITRMLIFLFSHFSHSQECLQALAELLPALRGEISLIMASFTVSMSKIVR